MPDGGQERDERLTRRGLIGAGAAAGAAAALSRVPGAEARRKGQRGKRRRKRHADVVVVGAGFAGLTAALRIAQAGSR
jgi:heterodisulfide reductase subunit A-like polyferredoxin